MGEIERDLFGREVLDILGGFDGLVYHSKRLVKLLEIAIHNGRVLKHTHTKHTLSTHTLSTHTHTVVRTHMS